MYCSACKLEFPDNLNFCKQCGRPLVVQPEDSSTLSKCCTRCGARVVAGESFCQQCGARAKTKTQDTTIGACQQCSTPWRSAWLYCRNCGLDRDRALDLGAMPAIPDQSAQTMTTEVVSIHARVEDDSLRCPRCEANATPYAQFCEVCGQSLTSPKVEPLAIEEDAEVDFNTLEVILPPRPPEQASVDGDQTQREEPDAAEEPDGVEEEELDPSRTTERVLALQTVQPDTNPIAGSETYVTQESKPVTITELYYGDELTESPEETASEEDDGSASETGEDPDTTSLEPLRQTPVISPISAIRMTVEGRAISIDELQDTNEEETGAIEDEELVEPVSTRIPSTSLGSSPDRSRQAVWQAGAIILCLLVLFVLIAIIAWNEFSRRNQRIDARVGPTPTTTATTTRPSVAAGPVVPEGMVYIPGGTLRMGREGGDKFERPTHSVAVAPFFMDRTEVTNEQYQKFITETGRNAPSHWQAGAFATEEGKFPVVNVSWQDAAEYARWSGRRLPTEAEWEFAARGTQAKLYPWGEKWETGRSNTREGGAGRIVAVGSFPQGASQFGILDLSGNVWEWTANELTSYADSNQVLAPGRVIRGGAWDVPRDRATATYRGVVQPERAYDKTGFRCAK